MDGIVSVLIAGGRSGRRALPGAEVRSERGPPENNREINGKKLVQSGAGFVVLSRPRLGLRWISGLAVVSEVRCVWLKSGALPRMQSEEPELSG